MLLKHWYGHLLCAALTIKCTYGTSQSQRHIPKIAIVGGGIGGTATAYFLHEYLGDDVILDLYEPGEIGGRLATTVIGGREYEIGGSIIHPKNNYMVDFAKKFGLGQVTGCPAVLGIYNGADYVYKDSSWEFIGMLKLLWRYGYDLVRLNKLTENMLKEFASIYKLQDQGKAYKDVDSMLSNMDPDFKTMTKMSTKDFLRSKGFHDKMIDELVMAVTRANYGQTPNIQAFVGAVAVAGAEPNLWAVENGNKRVPEELLKHSRATLLKRKVTDVAYKEGGFVVSSVEVEDENNNSLYTEGAQVHTELNEFKRHHEYDVVILGTPLTHDKSMIKFQNFTKELKFPGQYERIICTMVEGEARAESLNFDKSDPVEEILTTNPSLIFNTFGKQFPVDVTDCSQDLPTVWKIFSPEPLTEEQLDYLFEVRREVHVTDWLAYPHYNSRQDLGNFQLFPGLYYINAIEFAGSAMEMSAIGARNVALLAFKHLTGNADAGAKAMEKDEL
ncbi:prenylcysteine oxidase 1-like [Oratosquilla oratoria]|uniref:prenylcysteine oxidase 1-like n=1 Tax=Oratosquilla oratoria TaxID=337810 RepID=UPI003F766588